MEYGQRSWKEFQDIGLLWWINRILHTFGWAITLIQQEDGTVINVYPVRCKFRGFNYEDEDAGFRKVSNWIATEGRQLKEEVDL